MATLRILAYETIGANAKHESSDWIVDLDPKKKYIVDQSLDDTEHLTEWITPLPKRPEHKEFGEDVEEFYTDEVALYAFVRLRIGNVKTGWLSIPVKTQKYQEYDVTEDNADTYKSDSIKLGMVTEEELVPPEYDYGEDEDTGLDETVKVKYCFDCRRSNPWESTECQYCGCMDFTATQSSVEILKPEPEVVEPDIPEPEPDVPTDPDDKEDDGFGDDIIEDDDLDLDDIDNLNTGDDNATN